MLSPHYVANVEILREFSQRKPSGKSHRLELRFLRSPVEILGEGADGPVTGVRVGINRLVMTEDGRVRAEPTGKEEVIECGLVTWSGWEAIDAYESAQGQPAGRPRVKLVRVDELSQASRHDDNRVSADQVP